MSASRSNNKKKGSFFSNLRFRKERPITHRPEYVSRDEINVFRQSIKKYTIGTMDDDDVEVINIYLEGQPDDISSKHIEMFNSLRENHKRRLNVDVVVFGELSHFPISENSSLIFTSCNKWTKHIINSIENLEETHIYFKKGSVDETALYYLARSIAHLTNCIHTISDMSVQTPQTLDNIGHYYMKEIITCINGFQTDFCKFCQEVNLFVGEFKTTLKLLIDKDPQNKGIIYSMNDIEKLYGFANSRTQNINTGTPNDINTSIRFIDAVSNDINDTKLDVIYIKRHQYKDEKYLRSTYV
jgi:hypothetical protein